MLKNYPIKVEAIFPKYYKNSSECFTFFDFGKIGCQGSINNFGNFENVL